MGIGVRGARARRGLLLIAFLPLIGALTPACGATDCATTATCGAVVADGAGDGGAGVYPEVPPPPGCDPSGDPKDALACVVDGYALFVDGVGGSNGGTGGRAAPLRTLAAATDVDKLRGRPRIYVCGVGPYPESVNLPPNVSLIGGFECATWTYAGAKAKLAAPAGITALRVLDSDKGGVLSDLEISSADATEPGGSSVAALAIRSKVTLRRVAITAGEGKDAPSASTPSSNHSASPVDGITTASSAGAGARECACAAFGKTRAGRGGNATMAGEGGASEPEAVVTSARDAKGGSGGPDSSCTSGNAGSDGAAGAEGAGASSLGILAADGWTPGHGSDGRPGSPGAGGGGGGGNKSLGGGGGACGGCGGAGGIGAAGGGGSIALAALDSDVKLVECSLTTKAAGAGGLGGQGEEGASGGTPGSGACAGGHGGNGGGGGGGGGGAGGVSAPVLRSGGSVEKDDATTLTPGKAGFRGLYGFGGPGGSNTVGVAAPGSNGTEGVAGAADEVVVVMPP